MDTGHLAVLVRAVAALRRDADDAAALIDALAPLIAATTPALATARAVTRRALPVPALAPTSVLEDDDDLGEAPPIAPVPAVSSPSPVPGAGRSVRPLPQQGDIAPAMPSTLTQTSERADLSTPRGNAVGHATEPQRMPEAAGPSAPLESLFAPGRVRAILRELSTLASPTGRADTAAVVRLIARAEPIAALPQRVATSLGHSIQLLFDAGPAMLPFARDKQQLAASAARLLGKDRVRVADFIGDPLQGVRAQRQVRWQPLRWPPRRSALVVVSDLGLGSGDAQARLLVEAWQRFLDDAERRGLRSVLLIPYARERWPDVAHGFETALTWDLATGVQALRRSARAAHTAR